MKVLIQTKKDVCLIAIYGKMNSRVYKITEKIIPNHRENNSFILGRTKPNASSSDYFTKFISSSSHVAPAYFSITHIT